MPLMTQAGDVIAASSPSQRGRMRAFRITMATAASITPIGSMVTMKATLFIFRRVSWSWGASPSLAANEGAMLPSLIVRSTRPAPKAVAESQPSSPRPGEHDVEVAEEGYEEEHRDQLQNEDDLGV